MSQGKQIIRFKSRNNNIQERVYDYDLKQFTKVTKTNEPDGVGESISSNLIVKNAHNSTNLKTLKNSDGVVDFGLLNPQEIEMLINKSSLFRSCILANVYSALTELFRDSFPCGQLSLSREYKNFIFIGIETAFNELQNDFSLGVTTNITDILKSLLGKYTAEIKESEMQPNFLVSNAFLVSLGKIILVNCFFYNFFNLFFLDEISNDYSLMDTTNIEKKIKDKLSYRSVFTSFNIAGKEVYEMIINIVNGKKSPSSIDTLGYLKAILVENSLKTIIKTYQITTHVILFFNSINSHNIIAKRDINRIILSINDYYENFLNDGVFRLRTKTRKEQKNIYQEWFQNGNTLNDQIRTVLLRITTPINFDILQKYYSFDPVKIWDRLQAEDNLFSKNQLENLVQDLLYQIKTKGGNDISCQWMKKVIQIELEYGEILDTLIVESFDSPLLEANYDVIIDSISKHNYETDINNPRFIVFSQASYPSVNFQSFSEREKLLYDFCDKTIEDKLFRLYALDKPIVLGIYIDRKKNNLEELNYQYYEKEFMVSKRNIFFLFIDINQETKTIKTTTIIKDQLVTAKQTIDTKIDKPLLENIIYWNYIYFIIKTDNTMVKQFISDNKIKQSLINKAFIALSSQNKLKTFLSEDNFNRIVILFLFSLILK